SGGRSRPEGAGGTTRARRAGTTTGGPMPGEPRRTVLVAGGGTGGHLMPALAIAAALLPGRDFRYRLLPSEPIYRRAWWKNRRWPVIAGRLMRRVARLFAEESPAAVVGTGGYASAPVVLWAVARGVPAAIQEQNAYPGLASRWLSRLVRHVYLGLPEARRLLRFGRRTEVFETGNPIAPPTPERRPIALARFGLDGDRPVVLVTGGSQGALALN